MNVNLDTRITIKSRSVTNEGTYGSEVVTWPTFATPWAEWKEVAPSNSESVRQGLEVARNQVRVRIRYLAGVDSSMRIARGAVVYRIVGGPSEVGGRHQYLELMLERYSTAGA